MHTNESQSLPYNMYKNSLWMNYKLNITAKNRNNLKENIGEDLCKPEGV